MSTSDPPKRTLQQFVVACAGFAADRLQRSPKARVGRKQPPAPRRCGKLWPNRCRIGPTLVTVTNYDRWQTDGFLLETDDGARTSKRQQRLSDIKEAI